MTRDRDPAPNPKRPRKAHHTSDVPKSVRRALAHFTLSLANFDRFVTLTFRLPVTVQRARNLLRTFLQRLARERAEGHFWCVPAGSSYLSGERHFHLLLALPSKVSNEAICALWNRLDPSTGRCESVDARSAEAVAQYLAKHPECDPPFLVCPRTDRACRRPKGCAEFRSITGLSSRVTNPFATT